jgi:hypothetical protein
MIAQAKAGAGAQSGPNCGLAPPNTEPACNQAGVCGNPTMPAMKNAAIGAAVVAFASLHRPAPPYLAKGNNNEKTFDNRSRNAAHHRRFAVRGTGQC